MESVFKRTLILLTVIFSLCAHSFENEHYVWSAPAGRVDRPGLFGSDVMFLKKDNEGDGSVFVKLIDNNSSIGKPADFLLEKIKTSKSMNPTELSSVTTSTFNGHDFIYVTYKDLSSNQYVFTGMFKQTETKYLFVLLKDSVDTFSVEKDRVLSSLRSFRFKKK